MKIIATDKLDVAGVKMIEEAGHELKKGWEIPKEELPSIIGEYDAVLIRSATRVVGELMDACLAGNIKVIGRVGVGVDNVDVPKATEKKIPVVFAPTGSTLSVAEITVGQMIALARQLTYGDRTMKEGKWAKKEMMGMELSAKTVGLIGAGRIGSEVAKRCKAFGMVVIAFDPYLPKERAEEYGITLVDSVEKIYTDSDFISIHAVLTEETRGMVSTKAFEMMKDSAYLINYGRGGIIDELALADALKTNKIAGAALDVFETEPLPDKSPLRAGFDNLHMTPHIGAATKDAQVKAGIMTVQGVLDVLAGKKPEFCVNPEVLS